MTIRKTMLFALAAVAAATAAQAWAGPGRGCWQGDLSEADAQKVEEARKAFHESTLPTRQKIHQKRAELAAALAQEAIDGDKAAALQKEISDLNAEMDQKRLQHRIQMKSILPFAGLGMGGGMDGEGCGRWHGCGGPGGDGPGGGGCDGPPCGRHGQGPGGGRHHRM